MRKGRGTEADLTLVCPNPGGNPDEKKTMEALRLHGAWYSSIVSSQNKNNLNQKILSFISLRMRKKVSPF
jgi:hypothetical protein